MQPWASEAEAALPLLLGEVYCPPSLLGREVLRPRGRAEEGPSLPTPHGSPQSPHATRPLPAPPPYIADRPLYYAPEPEAPPPPVVEPERDVLREAMGRRELGLKTRSFDQDILSAGGGLQSSVHQADDDMPDMALTRR